MRDKLDALCSAEVLRLQVVAFASPVVGRRPGSRVQEVQAAVAQPRGDGQVESGRAMYSPVRDINIGRFAAVAIPNPVLRQPILVRARRQEARFLTSGWSPAGWALAAKTESKRLWPVVLSPPQGQPRA